MSKERFRIGDLYPGLPYQRIFDRFPPETTFNDAEEEYRENTREWLMHFCVLGVDITPGIVMEEVIKRAGPNKSIADLPEELKNGTSIEPSKRPLPEFLETCKDITVILNRETYPAWRQTINEEKHPVGLVPTLSNTYDYKGQIKPLLADLEMNGIVILGLSWVVDSPFACAQRRSGTPDDTGLTPVGKELIHRLINDFPNPIAVDLAHLSHESMRQVIEIFDNYSANLQGKGIIYSHGAVWDIYPGNYEEAAKGFGQQNIPIAILQELARLNERIPVLVQIMPWKGSFANQDHWGKITQKEFFELQLQHAQTVMDCNVPVAFTSDWSLHPLYRNQFINPFGPLGLLELREFVRGKNEEMAKRCFRNNQLTFLDGLFGFHPTG